MFFVLEKDGRLRLIVDARRSNCHFADPNPVSRCTGDALGGIELEPGETLYICMADLKDAFYHFSLPLSWRKYFGLRPIRAGLLGATHLNGKPVSETIMIYPRLAAIPMGWTWALWWCQTLHERIVETAGCSDNCRLKDFKPVPPTGSYHTQYVNNFISIGPSKHDVTYMAKEAVGALRSSGLVVHEEVDGAVDCAALGWTLQGPSIFRPSRRRVWRARLAIRLLLRVGRCSGKTLEKILGHLSFISLGRR